MLEYSEYVDKDIKSPKFFFYISRIKDAHKRLSLLDWFTPRQRYTLPDIPTDIKGANIISVKGKKQELDFFDQYMAVHVSKPDNNSKYTEISEPCNMYYVYGVYRIPGVDDTILLIKISDDAGQPPFAMHEQFMLDSGMIDNYKGTAQVTDVGKFLLNQLLLVEPFGDMVPYINSVFSPKKLDAIVAQLILEGKATREQYNKYMNYGYWYGEDGSLATPTWSEKSLTTDPNIQKRKQELLDKYKDNLDDPNTLSAIEAELVQMDKDYLKGDSSAPFYAVTAGKAFPEQRKKMYITFGLTVAFDKNSGNYEFVEDSLSDGWKAQTLAVASNDIRRGSYGRGVETAKGGEQTKFVLRIFQDVEVVSEDCLSKRGLPVNITDGNKKDYIGRWTVDDKLITEENCSTFIGKTVTLRSPMFCLAKPGFCFKCAGELYRKLDMKSIGMNAVVITSTMTNLAMKSMHVSGIQATKITDFHKFLR